jgi:hypothetical protein
VNALALFLYSNCSENIRGFGLCNFAIDRLAHLVRTKTFQLASLAAITLVFIVFLSPYAASLSALAAIGGAILWTIPAVLSALKLCCLLTATLCVTALIGVGCNREFLPFPKSVINLQCGVKHMIAAAEKLSNCNWTELETEKSFRNLKAIYHEYTKCIRTQPTDFLGQLGNHWLFGWACRNLIMANSNYALLKNMNWLITVANLFADATMRLGDNGLLAMPLIDHATAVFSPPNPYETVPQAVADLRDARMRFLVGLRTMFGKDDGAADVPAVQPYCHGFCHLTVWFLG